LSRNLYLISHMKEKGIPGTLARMNKRSIVEYMLEKGPCSRAELVKNLSISFPSVSSNVRDLMQAGFIAEEGVGNQNKVGRNSVILKLNPDSCSVLAVHLEIDEMRIGIADFTGAITMFEPVRKLAHRNMTDIIENIVSVMKKLEVQIPGFQQRLSIISIGVHGIKSEKKKKNYLHLLRDMTDLKEGLQERLGVSVFIDNDVNMAVLGEKWHVIGNKYKNIVYVNIEGGIGAGIIIDNKIYRGSQNAAGEIGHMLLNRRHCDINLGDEGALENSLIHLFDNSPENNESNHPKTIDESLFPEKAVEYAAMMLVNLVSVLNPEVIIMGGRTGIKLMDYSATIQKIMEKNLPTNPPTLVLSKTGENATVYGAFSVGLKIARDNIYNNF
jgi:predicted NBD/HSP70 family sugar kinase